MVHARDFGSRGDRFNTVGCIARAAYFLIHTFFAVNETYYFGDKGCIEALQSFPILAAGFAHRIEAALAPTENDAQVLSQRVADLIELFRETVDLVRGDYTPKFGLESDGANSRKFSKCRRWHLFPVPCYQRGFWYFPGTARSSLAALIIVAAPSRCERCYGRFSLRGR